MISEPEGQVSAVLKIWTRRTEQLTTGPKANSQRSIEGPFKVKQLVSGEIVIYYLYTERPQPIMSSCGQRCSQTLQMFHVFLLTPLGFEEAVLIVQNASLVLLQPVTQICSTINACERILILQFISVESISGLWTSRHPTAGHSTASYII